MSFEIISQISDAEIIATGRGIRTLSEIRQRYGPGRWRKLKGVASVRLATGRIRRAELHWYEAHGVGNCTLGQPTIGRLFTNRGQIGVRRGRGIC